MRICESIPWVTLLLSFMIPTLSHPSAIARQNSDPPNPNPSVESFLSPDGQFDLDAARRSGYQGALDFSGMSATIVPTTGKLVFSAPAANVPEDVFWTDGFTIPGMDYPVKALAVYDGKLVAGGHFTTVGSLVANFIAAWDGNAWSVLGSGMNEAVIALTVFENQLIAGGAFTTAGGIGANYIASWDGSDWLPLGSGLNNSVLTLTVFDSRVIAGGNFSTAGGLSANRIAAWDGTAWEVLGAGMNDQVMALTVYDSKLVAGGTFTSAGGQTAGRVAAWDGSAWFPLGQGMNNSVLTLAVFNSTLFAGGYFNSADGNTANSIAAWNGFIWSSLGSGISNGVVALAVFDSRLIVGGYFGSAGGTPATGIAAWDGSTWTALGAGMDNWTVAFTTFDSQLIAAGAFETAGGTPASRIAAWNESTWSALSTTEAGLSNAVNSLVEYDGSLVAGGFFKTAGNLEVNYISLWDGEAWTQLGSGMNAGIEALAIYNSQLIAAGHFTTAGGTEARYIASWSGSTWSALGTGMNSWVRTVTVFGAKLIAGGDFTVADGAAASHIAAWDGSTWEALGSGTDSLVLALTVYDSHLIAGGQFTNAGGQVVNRIAAWNGSIWSPLASGLDRDVYALTVFDSRLFTGGEYSNAGGLDFVHAWDGTTWTDPAGGLNSTVYALAVYDDQLIAGGYFTPTGGWGSEASRIAVLQGSSWEPLGSGIGRWAVHTLHSYGGSLFVGGEFGAAGGKASANIAEWTKHAQDTCMIYLENNIVPNEPGECGAHVDYNLVVEGDCHFGCPDFPAAASFFPVGTTYMLRLDTTCLPPSDPFPDCDTLVLRFVTYDSVVVYDIESPEIVCPSGTSVFVSPGLPDTVIDFAIPDAFDNCGDPVVECTPLPGSTFPVGTTLVTAVATDSSGNSDTCRFNVTVSSPPIPHERLDFYCQENGPAPPPETFFVNGVPGATWTLQKGGQWMGVSKTSGIIPDTVEVTADPGGLHPRIYRGSMAITIESSGSPAQFVDVSLHVNPSVELGSNTTLAGTSDSIPIYLTHDVIDGLFLPLSYANSTTLAAGVQSAGFRVDSLRISPYYLEFGMTYELDTINQTIIVQRVPVRNEPIPKPDTVDVALVGIIYYSTTPLAAGTVVTIDTVSTSCPDWKTEGDSLCSIFYEMPDGSIVIPNFEAGVIVIGSADSPEFPTILWSDSDSLLFICDESPGPVPVTIQQVGPRQLPFTIAPSSIFTVEPSSGYTPMDVWVTPTGCPRNETVVMTVTSEMATQSLEIPVQLEYFDAVVEHADTTSIPQVFRLGQNYPNPFNGVTVIEYAVPSRTQVDLAVYNILGQRVETLVAGERPPGQYRVTWDARLKDGHDLASGLYLVRMAAGDFVQTRKVVLMK